MIEETIEKLGILLQGEIPDEFDTEKIVDKSNQKLAKMLNQLIVFMKETHDFIIPLSRGELAEINISPKNFFGSPFKELHANLLHLTWQTKQVANGDYNQHIDFMGDFSEAFNTMIISLENNEKLLIQRALIDPLTQLANRRHLDMVLEKEWARMKRGQTALSVLMCDVDFFKLYNDTYGHKQGDECLKAVSRAILENIRRPADFAARYGGEEFIVILPDTSLEGSLYIAQKIRKAIQDLNIEHSASSVSDHVTISIGVASVVPSDHNNVEEVLKLADEALYESKEQGRNRATMLSG